MNRRTWIFIAKLAVSAGIIWWIVRKIDQREGSEALWTRLAELSWPWIIAAAAMQLCAITASVTRWKKLLGGQGIHAPVRHLVGSFMIGRFFGAFAPGGWTGLNGYRLYDIATHTGKVARSTATIGIEMVTGNLGMGAVVVAGSFFGARFIGLEGVLLVDAFFIALISVAVLVIARPLLFRKLAQYIPGIFRARLQTTVDAVCAYQGKGWLVTQAALLGISVHAFNSMIYVMTARALNVELGVGEVFFAVTIQIFSTLLPASINGIGLREATAVALFTQVGIPPEVAVLIPVLGFIVEMSVSSIGGLIFVSRRVGYQVEIQVDDAEHEELVHAEIPEVPQEQWPKLGRGLSLGLGAGLLAGVVIGLAEATVILLSSADTPDLGVLAYGAVAYGLLCAIGGAGFGLVSAQTGRWMRRGAMPEAGSYARLTAACVAFFGFALGAFRIRRDVFAEQLAWKSLDGLMVLFGSLLAAGLLFLVLAFVLERIARGGPGRVLLKSWGTPAVVAGLIAALSGVALAGGNARPEPNMAGRPEAPALAGNILYVVVDTLRADHLPAYGYTKGETPHLDAFRKDAVLYQQAFANASWTRPSFASLLTGRYPASHKTMDKPSLLPDDVVTLGEALQGAGYYTAGVVTNYNVAPFFNFHQGFDDYRYLEPTFVLGANDTAAKLLLVQSLRRVIEKARASGGNVERGSAYQDAEVVNRELLSMLDAVPRDPWLMFAGYMDPHDPYYPHPFDGTGFSRAANQHPDPSEAPRLRDLYDGEISYWDEHFGALLQALKQRGVYDDMTIVVTSDHGEEFMDHGGYWHGTTLYDEQLHVPLLVKYPVSRLGGTKVSHWVESVDIMPTLLKEAGVAWPKGMQGKHLATASAKVFAQESHEGNVLESLRLREGASELKLITANEGNPRGLKPTELYRVDRDPDERDELSDRQPEDVKVASIALAATAQAAGEGAATQRSVDLTADQNAIDRLKALGYVEDEETPEPGEPTAER